MVHKIRKDESCSCVGDGDKVVPLLVVQGGPNCLWIGAEQIIAVDSHQVFFNFALDWVVVYFRIGKQIAENGQHFYYILKSDFIGVPKDQAVFIEHDVALNYIQKVPKVHVAR